MDPDDRCVRRHSRAAPPAAPGTATTGTGTTVTLGRATGGSDGPVTARVQWGDASVTSDATVAVRNGVDVITGTHTWTRAGSYSVHVTVSDGSTSTTSALTVVVTDRPQQAVAVAPSTTSPGDTVAATGVGFTPGEQVTVALSTAVSSCRRPPWWATSAT